ncbi:MAG: cupin domain-containing protein [Solirubrobacteraceae bacterium]|jgi:mannose-6-phosphate isomerase-like protein (cupin superfamily)
MSSRVVDARAVPVRAGAGDQPTVRATVGGAGPDGLHGLEQSVLDCSPGRSRPRATGDCEEVLFVLAGRGALELDGVTHELEPESGAYLAPGECYELVNTGPAPLTLVSVRIPDPNLGPAAGPALGPRAVVRRLAEQEAETATAQREFRIVADPRSGLRSATHFVGYVPPGRAPDHFHAYDEVIYVLEGTGTLHVDGVEQPLGPGSCLQLPARTVHCLENSGREVLRLVAVFRPAGSPAAAYYPDGTPAHAAAPQLNSC